MLAYVTVDARSVRVKQQFLVLRSVGAYELVSVGAVPAAIMVKRQPLAKCMGELLEVTCLQTHYAEP